MSKRLDDAGGTGRDPGFLSYDDYNDDDSDDVYDEPDQYRVLPSVSVGGRRLRSTTAWMIKIGIAFALIAAVAYGGYQYWYLRQINPPGEDSVATVFTITENDDLDSISRRLLDEGVIVNDGVFRRYVRQEGGLEIIPGIYTLRGKDHMGNLLRVLRTPPQETLTRVTFPEGFTLSQMSRRLAEN
ncbi:MAG: endolytic transglycosylase MltG, partial [Actinomycetota bacterium]